jgi:hypothetical protein
MILVCYLIKIYFFIIHTYIRTDRKHEGVLRDIRNSERQHKERHVDTIFRIIRERAEARRKVYELEIQLEQLPGV